MKKLISALCILGMLPLAAAADPVAKIGDREISKKELEDSVRAQLIEIENNRYEILETGLDEMVTFDLLTREAEARSITVEELQEAEITSKLAPPSEEEIQRIYEENQGRLEGKALDDVREMIVSYVQQRDAKNLAMTFLDGLKTKYGVKIMLAAPVFEVALGRHPGRGGDSAPITIVGFSDYECPYCRVGETTIERVMETYGDKVRYFHRDYPLPFHANAKEASQAASCAGDQEKFWAYHTALFLREELSTEVFRGLADELELDREAFDECLASGRYAAAVDADAEAGAALGVSGTPAFFINGRSLSGAQPFDAFKKVIDAELAKASGN